MTVSRVIFDERIRQAVKASAIEVQDEAQTHHNYTSRTGNLTRAVDMRMTSECSAMVYINSDIASYGPFVHEGTKAHTIAPKQRKCLRWVPTGGNGFIFAKSAHHPGTKKDPFLYEALNAKRTDIIRIFSCYTVLALNDVANAITRKHGHEYGIDINL
ncbi:hypothetical protein ACSZOP_06400 [Colibacter massiliensis]|uniref:hypothetical protein n=1 Tax=Colibacter massiliensis TaxID=1852379 RepID=UPI003F92C2AE